MRPSTLTDEPPDGVDAFAWERFNAMPPEERVDYLAACEERLTALRDADISRQSVTALIGAAPDAAPLAELRELARHDSVAAQAVEALAHALAHAARLEAGMIDRGWLTEPERWTADDANGDPMIAEAAAS